MEKKFFLGIAVAAAIIFFAAAVATDLPKNTAPAKDRDILYQVSTIDALMQGAFDGTEQISETLQHGDFGIGTFDGLDGEMILLDGKVYQARANGAVYPVPGNLTTPLATVTYFESDRVIKTDHPMNLTALSDALFAQLPSQNMIYAVKIHGTFPEMIVRAIPRQEKPYPTLTVAAKNQSVYVYKAAKGTVVGFYTPVFFKGLNVAGFHLHFISDDKKTGGHILDMIAGPDTVAELDITDGFAMSLPTSGSFTGVDLSQDLSSALAKVER
jgi:acetolactate decarboxylase